jgi:hypothetical protein
VVTFSSSMDKRFPPNAVLEESKNEGKLTSPTHTQPQACWLTTGIFPQEVSFTYEATFLPFLTYLPTGGFAARDTTPQNGSRLSIPPNNQARSAPNHISSLSLFSLLLALSLTLSLFLFLSLK